MFNSQIQNPRAKNSGTSKQGTSEFEQLVLPILDSLYNFACWMTLNPQRAEDLVQQTIDKGLRNFHTFRAGTNFRSWIFTILRNIFLHSRSLLAQQTTLSIDEEEGETATDIGSWEVVCKRLADSQAVRQAISTLPLDSREILVLRDIEEMNYREITEILSIPIGTVMSRLARARNTIRLLLTPAPPRNRCSVAEAISPAKHTFPSPEMALAIFILMTGPQ